jgi:chaperone required for assembly of F1-ATPase
MKIKALRNKGSELFSPVISMANKVANIRYQYVNLVGNK